MGLLTITATLCLRGPGAISVFFIPESFLAHRAPPTAKLEPFLSNQDAPVATSVVTTTVLE